MRAIALTAILALASCKGSATNWPRAVNCAVPSADLASSVSDILLRDGQAEKLTPESKRDLASVGATWGLQAVSCAIAWAVDTWMQQSKSMSVFDGPTIDLGLAAKRGAAFLEEEGIR